MTQTPLLSIHPKKTIIQKDISTPVFTVALFTITRTWKQPRCPSTDEWIKKLWYMYTMEYHSAIKRNVSESVLMRWMNLEPIIQSEVSQKGKNKYVNTYICNLEKWYWWTFWGRNTGNSSRDRQIINPECQHVTWRGRIQSGTDTQMWRMSLWTQQGRRR